MVNFVQNKLYNNIFTKKSFLFFFMALTAAMMFTSCETIDEDFQGTYQYYAPLTDWNAEMKDVKKFMEKQKGWKQNLEVPSEHYIQYTHKKTGMTLDYKMSGTTGKLKKVTLKYINCASEYQHMLQDMTDKFGVEWDGVFETNQEAHCDALDCDLWAYVSKINDTEHITIQYTHASKQEAE